MSNEEQKPVKQPLISQADYDQATEDASIRLSAATVALLQSHGFIGHILQMLNRNISLEVPTAGVGFADGRFNLWVNPFFFRELDSKGAKAVLLHEIYHLLNEHLTRLQDGNPKLFNYAADIAINQHIQDLPMMDHEQMKQKLIKEVGLTEAEANKRLPKPDKDGKFCSALLPEQFNFPRNKTTEWYYNALLQDPEMQKQMGKAGGEGEGQEMDINDLNNMTDAEREQLKQDIKDGKVKVSFGKGSHEKWEGKDGESKASGQIQDEELRRMIRDARDRDPSSFGHLPHDMQQQILKFLTTKINWKQQLKSFIQVATEIFRQSTRSRRNRRFGITYAGNKIEQKLNLGIMVDTSGSIGDEDLALFGGEINKIFDVGNINIEVMSADTMVHEHYKMKKKMLPKDFKLKGGGGTAAQPWLDYVSKTDLDALIILTDGCFDYNLTKPRYPILWCLTEHGYTVEDFKKGVKFGKYLKLEKPNT